MSGNRLALKQPKADTHLSVHDRTSPFSAGSFPGRGAAITHDYLHCGMDNLQILNGPVKIVIERPGSPGRGGRAPFMGRTVRRRGQSITRKKSLKAAPCSLLRRWPDPVSSFCALPLAAALDDWQGSAIYDALLRDADRISSVVRLRRSDWP